MVARVTIHDDVTDEPGAVTRSLGFDGVDYELDLTDETHEKLRALLAPYLDVARKVGKRPAPRRKPSTSPAPPPSAEHDEWYRTKPDDAPATKRIKADYRADVAAWAREHGYTVPERGRISRAVFAAYEAANGVDPRRADVD